MSGNPFRASLVPQYPAAPPTSSYAPDARTPEARHEPGSEAVPDLSSTHSARTKKSVRIESPTETIPPHPVLYNDDGSPVWNSSPTVHHEYQPGPSAHETHAESSSTLKDGGIGGASNPGQSDSRAMREGPPGYFDPHENIKLFGGAPVNPFARTLAHLEPRRAAAGAELEEQSKDRISGEQASAGTSKAALDVESFKNMLMTGISSPRGSGPPPLPQHNAPAANAINNAPILESSSTDTSSASRQSIFEPAQETQPESPHTLYDMAASDDEKAKFVEELNRKEKRRSLPPPAPKRRHGKPVNSRTPQTVSFDEFAVTPPTASPVLATKKSDTDSSKPLPPTPPTVSPLPNITSQNISNDSQVSNRAEPVDQFDATPVAQKKVPPPVPLARRHSQLRNPTTGNRSRSNSSLTISSQHSVELAIASPNLKEEPPSASSHKSPPPPPPTRHRGSALPTIGHSSASSSVTDVSSSGTARRPTVTSPNPPSSRRTTITSDPPSPKPSLGRTSSVHSTRSSHRIVSNESTGSTLPPPPPPPRRRQSGRSTSDKDVPQQPSSNPSSPIVETRRQSTEYKRASPDSKRRASAASESSLKYEYAPPPPLPITAVDNEHPLYSPQEEELEEEKVPPLAESANHRPANRASILDDMDKLQKEIDELKERYEHAA